MPQILWLFAGWKAYHLGIGDARATLARKGHHHKAVYHLGIGDARATATRL